MVAWLGYMMKNFLHNTQGAAWCGCPVMHFKAPVSASITVTTNDSTVLHRLWSFNQTRTEADGGTFLEAVKTALFSLPILASLLSPCNIWASPQGWGILLLLICCKKPSCTFVECLHSVVLFNKTRCSRVLYCFILSNCAQKQKCCYLRLRWFYSSFRWLDLFRDVLRSPGWDILGQRLKPLAEWTERFCKWFWEDSKLIGSIGIWLQHGWFVLSFWSHRLSPWRGHVLKTCFIIKMEAEGLDTAKTYRLCTIYCV